MVKLTSIPCSYCDGSYYFLAAEAEMGIWDDIARHRAMAVAHGAVAKYLKSGKKMDLLPKAASRSQGLGHWQVLRNEAGTLESRPSRLDSDSLEAPP